MKSLNLMKKIQNFISNVNNIKKFCKNLMKFLTKEHIINALTAILKDRKMKIVAIWFVEIAHKTGVIFVI